jgi:hypothetical protein
MSHEITAYIVPEQLAEHLHGKGFQHLHSVRLEQGFLLVPVMFELYLELEQRYPGETEENESWTPSHGIVAFGKELSQHGPVAYIETHYWGGSGTQAAVAWKDGTTILEPEEKKWNIINEALFEIGVERMGDKDRFEALGLDNYRSLSDCAEAAETQADVQQVSAIHDSRDEQKSGSDGVMSRIMKSMRRLFSRS